MNLISLRGFVSRRRSMLTISCLVALFILILLIARGTDPQPTKFAILSSLLAGILIALSVIDLIAYRLPNVLTLPLLALGIGFAGPIGVQGVLYRATSGLACFLLFYAFARIYATFRSRTGIGLGDVKLLAAGSAWLGIEQLPYVVLFASSSCLATIACLALFNRRIDLRTRIPFGPFIAVSIWTMWVVPP